MCAATSEQTFKCNGLRVTVNIKLAITGAHIKNEKQHPT